MIGLVRDVLDKKLCDRNSQPYGRADGVIIEVREGRPPRVVAIEVGLGAVARRLGPRVGRWVTGFLESHGPRVPASIRVPWDRVEEIKPTSLSIDDDVALSPLHVWEDWLRRHVVERLPWSAR